MYLLSAEVWLAAFKPAEDFYDVSEFCARYVCGIDDATMQAAARMVDDHRPYLDAYARRIDEILELCRRNGIEPVLLTQPALNGDAVDPTTGVRLDTAAIGKDANGHVNWLVQELYNDVTRRKSAAASVLLIDLAREMPKDSKYFADWIHFTGAGAALVGELVYRHLEPRLAQSRS